MAANIIFLAKDNVPSNVIKPNSIDLLPPESCAPSKTVEFKPALKYSVFAPSVPSFTS